MAAVNAFAFSCSLLCACALFLPAPVHGQDLCSSDCTIALELDSHCDPTSRQRWEEQAPLQVWMRCSGACCLPGLDPACHRQHILVSASSLHLQRQEQGRWTEVPVEFARSDATCGPWAAFVSEEALPPGDYLLFGLSFSVAGAQPSDLTRAPPAAADPLPSRRSRGLGDGIWIDPLDNPFYFEWSLAAGGGFAEANTSFFGSSANDAPPRNLGGSWGTTLALGFRYQRPAAQTRAGGEALATLGAIALDAFIGNQFGLDLNLSLSRNYGQWLTWIGLMPIIRSVYTDNQHDDFSQWRFPGLLSVLLPGAGVALRSQDDLAPWIGWSLACAVLLNHDFGIELRFEPRFIIDDANALYQLHVGLGLLHRWLH